MKNPGFRVVTILLLAALVAPQAGQAVVTFTQLDEDIFVVSHRVKFIGSRGQATRLVYEKAASLCVAADYTYFKILQQESEASQHDDTANATLRVQFYFDDGEGRISCDKNASQEYIAQAGTKLAKLGYVPPARPEPSGHAPAAAGSEDWSCTVEQITAMVKVGLSEPQIKAACPD